MIDTIKTKIAKFRIAGLAAAALVLTVMLAGGCGGGGGTAAKSSADAVRTGSVRITVPRPAAAIAAARAASKIPSTTAKVSIVVEGKDLASPITAEASFPDGQDFVTVTIPNIPAGVNTITINALDSANEVLATRTQKVTIIEGKYIPVEATLGFSITGKGVVPSAISFNLGDAVVIKNNSSVSTLISVAGSTGSMYLGEQGQFKVFPTRTGAVTINAGEAQATANVVQATATEMKVGIIASTTYGEGPLQVLLASTYFSGGANMSGVTFAWDFGGGSECSNQLTRTAGSAPALGQTCGSFSAPGDYEVTLTITADGKTAHDDIIITVIEAQPPVVTSVSPTSASNTASSGLTITGSNFKSGAVITLDSTVVSGYVMSSTSINVTLPSGFAAGVYDVTVTNPDGKGSTIANALTVTGAGPTISEISPTRHTNNVSGTLSIFGTGFQTGATVRLNATAMTTTVVSATQLGVTIPVGFAPGIYSITITNPDNQTATRADAFTVLALGVSSCPADGEYWFAGTGGDNANLYYSERGITTITGLTVSNDLFMGNSSGTSDSPYTASATFTANGDGTFSIAGAEPQAITPNNDCSFMTTAKFQQGAWSNGFLAKKGTSADYAAVDVTGSWFFVSIGRSSAVKGVNGGQLNLSGGAVTGTIYSKNNLQTTEQTTTIPSGQISYTYNTATGEFTLSKTNSDVVFHGGVSMDGKSIVLGSSSGLEQSVWILARKPAAFSFSQAYGQWRGVGTEMNYQAGGGSSVEQMLINSSVFQSSSIRNETDNIGLDYSGDVSLTSDIQPDFAVTNDGAALVSTPGDNHDVRVFANGDFILVAETFSTDSAYINVLYKTDVIAPFGSFPTVSASVSPSTTVAAGQTVTMTATASDPASKPLTYHWKTHGGPMGFTPSTTSVMTFTPPYAGTYRFSVAVFNGELVAETEDIIITVTGTVPRKTKRKV